MYVAELLILAFNQKKYKLLLDQSYDDIQCVVADLSFCVYLLTYWRFEGGFVLAHLDYYNLEILCLIAWVITLTTLLPFFGFINNEFAGNLSHKPLSEVTIRVGVFTYELNTLITSLSEVPVGIIST
jgi:hypothetical protein